MKIFLVFLVSDHFFVENYHACRFASRSGDGWTSVLITPIFVTLWVCKHFFEYYISGQMNLWSFNKIHCCLVFKIILQNHSHFHPSTPDDPLKLLITFCYMCEGRSSELVNNILHNLLTGVTERNFKCLTGYKEDCSI